MFKNAVTCVAKEKKNSLIFVTDWIVSPPHISVLKPQQPPVPSNGTVFGDGDFEEVIELHKGFKVDQKPVWLVSF